MENRLADCELTVELERNADLQETCTITINLLELVGRVVTAQVMLESVGDRPDAAGASILMRSNNMTSVLWVSRSSSGATDERSFFLMIMLGRLDLAGGWYHTETPIRGVHNLSAHRFPPWFTGMLADKVGELIHSSDWP